MEKRIGTFDNFLTEGKLNEGVISNFFKNPKNSSKTVFFITDDEHKPGYYKIASATKVTWDKPGEWENEAEGLTYQQAIKEATSGKFESKWGMEYIGSIENPKTGMSIKEGEDLGELLVKIVGKVAGEVKKVLDKGAKDLELETKDIIDVVFKLIKSKL